MKIAAAQVGLQASHMAYQRETVSERLEAWVGERAAANGRPPAPPGPSVRELARPQVNISSAAQAANEAEAMEGADEEAAADPRMLFLKQIIEAMTGRAIRTLRPADLQPATREAAAPPSPGALPARRENAPAGFGMVYERHRDYTEYEHVRFEAQGSVRTSDGREIAFRIDFRMERLYRERSSEEVRIGDARLKDPLVLDFGGTAASLSDMRFEFDLDADGALDDVPLPGGSGFLAVDRDGNGRIDDGRELFGPTTGDGFAELAALDADGNGWIDEADPAFADLRVWSPAADGAGSLRDARSAGLGAIHLGSVATPFALRNADNQTLGVMRSSSFYLREDGSAGTLSQIDLSV